MIDCNANEEEILNCQFHSWFYIFEKFTIKSRIIDLPEDFVAYLLEDGVVLPSSVSNAFGRDELSDDEDLIDVTNKAQQTPAFKQLTFDIADAISSLSGNVLIKLNWSAPLDASWVSGGSLKCRSPADVYLLLKSSDRIAFDVEHIFDNCEKHRKQSKHVIDFKLVIRKWVDINPAMEFRLFVYKNQLRGIHPPCHSTMYMFWIWSH
jgi:hypothetical protein